MKSYEIFWSEKDTYRGWFDAENAEDAKRQLEMVENGELTIEELTGNSGVGKYYHFEIDFASLQEIGDAD